MSESKRIWTHDMSEFIIVTGKSTMALLNCKSTQNG